MGHPDWQTYPNWRGLPFISENAVFAVGATIVGTFAIKNYQSVLCESGLMTDQTIIQFDFGTDASMATIIDSYQLNLSSATGVKLILPVPANFVRVTVINSGLAPVNIAFNVTPVNIPVSKPTFFGNVNVVAQFNVSAAASATLQYQLPYMQPGQAFFWFNPRDNTGKLNFSVVAGSPAVAGGTVFRSVGPIAGDRLLLTLADRFYFVQVVNTDGAAAHSFDISLIPGF